MSFNPAGKQSQQSIFSKKRNKHSSTNATVPQTKSQKKLKVTLASKLTFKDHFLNLF